MSSPQLAFIGLGAMGIHMAKNIHNNQLANDGLPLIVYNRTRARAETLAEDASQVQIADSLADVAKRADIIFTCLLNDVAVTETIETLLLAGLKPGAIIVEQSTIAPATTIELTDKVIAAGGHFIACPIMGPPSAAAAAGLVVLVAGSRVAREEVLLHLVPAIGPKAIEVGEQPVDAVRLKLNGNYFAMSLVGMIADGMTLGEAVGISQHKVKELLDSLFPGTLIPIYADRMLRNTYRDQIHFPLTSARKDTNHMLDMAMSVGAKIPTIELFQEKAERVIQQDGDLDLSGVVVASRRDAGLDGDLRK